MTCTVTSPEQTNVTDLATREVAELSGGQLVLKAGAVIAEGAPAEVLTADLVREVFDLNFLVIDDPASGAPLVVPTDGQWR